MTSDASNAPKVPPIIQRFVKQLVVTHKAVVLYPPSSSIPTENAASTVATLRGILQSRHEMRLAVAKEGLVFEGLPVFPGDATYGAFARELYGRNLAEVRFHSGTTDKDVLALLALLAVSPEDIDAAGGFEARLWEQGVGGITVTEASVKIVDAPSPKNAPRERRQPPPGEPWPPTSQRIEELLVGAYGGRPRDQRLLARAIEDPDLVSTYLRETAAGRGEMPEDAWMSVQLSSLARAVHNELPEDQQHLFRALAEAVMGLDAQARQALLRDRLIADARYDEGLAGVLREIGIDEVCRVLAEGLAEDEASQEGLSRALRNLALIGLADRDEVTRSAGSAMRAAGVAEGAVTSVLAGASPSRIEVKETRRPSEQEPLERVLRLVDLAPTGSQKEVSEDNQVKALRAEARRGITDGDVSAALVTLVAVDSRPQQFATTMSMLEDVLEILLERGDYEDAADGAEGLSAALQGEELPEEQSQRIAGALEAMARPAQMRAITKALRMFPKGSWEHEACMRLLEVLGGHAMRPLLEVLADEPDMSARKALVELVAGMAAEHLQELGAALGDSRWYFVRNVVSILGSTRQSSALPYVERTLRHPDARVRRETIRSAAGIADRRSHELLTAALYDDDGQNVQLAARYLGALDVGGRTVKALEEVARGEGRGNRDIGSRVEAIEALGSLRAVGAQGTLKSLASKRGLFAAGRAKEVRAAAEAALAALSVARREAVGGDSS